MTTITDNIRAAAIGKDDPVEALAYLEFSIVSIFRKIMEDFEDMDDIAIRTFLLLVAEALET